MRRKKNGSFFLKKVGVVKSLGEVEAVFIVLIDIFFFFFFSFFFFLVCVCCARERRCGFLFSFFFCFCFICDYHPMGMWDYILSFLVFFFGVIFFFREVPEHESLRLIS